jgi:two-component system NarL family response regulator
MISEASSTSTTTIRILIADDHPSLRMGLGLILNNEPDMEVVAEATSGEEAVEIYKRLRPTITLMDLKMGEASGVDSINAIRKDFPAAKIIVLTTYDRDEDIYRSIRAGAMGYLVKDAAYEEIIQTIRTVYSGRKHYPSRISEKLAERLMMPDLSDRELEVLRLMARGQSNKEIADELSLALGTVKYHINNIYTKLSVEDRTQAVVMALRKGLAEL